jgi:ABC-type molybdate transport system substrate-binding protein
LFHETGREVIVTFVTAPVLRDQVDAGGAWADVIVAPIARMDAFEVAGNVVQGTRTILGSVKAGLVVRKGAPESGILSAEILKAAILALDSIVYNVATSGQYIVQMAEKLGIADAIRDRVVTVPNGSTVMMHLAESAVVNEIGFGQLTEIHIDLPGAWMEYRGRKDVSSRVSARWGCRSVHPSSIPSRLFHKP